MSIADFVPEFWVARFRRHLDSRLVYAQPTVVNREYEGEISQQGDTVHIPKIGDVTVFTYVKNTDMPSPEHPDGGNVSLVIDTAKGFNLSIDDIDKVQTIPGVFDQFAKRASRAMALVLDSGVAAKMVAGAGIKGGTLGTSAAPKKIGNAGTDDYTLFEFAVELRRLFDNNGAPEEDRWFAIPPDLENTALTDPNFIPAGSAEQRTGQIGRIAGFAVLKTTAVPTVTKTGSATYNSWAILAGAGNYATTHADQIVQVEAYKPEKQFGDALKGLNVWGTKVVEPETLALACIDKKA